MTRHWGRLRGPNHRSTMGASLVEVVVAMGIFASAVVAVFPVIFQSRKLAKHSEFNDLCQNAVRAKLNEYRFGARSTVTSANVGLSVETGLTATANTGFAYAKTRYNALRTSYCPIDTASTNADGFQWIPRAVTSMPPADPLHLGRQECIEGLGTGFPPTCSSVVDTRMQNIVRNFKIFVNLRRYNPILGVEDCPLNASTANWDFQHAEDMIKITVTGYADLSAGGSYAGITATHPQARELNCQLTDFIKPPPTLARYWLQNDGRIFRWQAKGDEATGHRYEVLAALANPSNLAISVSPDNKYVLVLRPGTLLRFEGCSGDPLQCPTTTIRTWPVDGNLVTMTAKWVNRASGASDHPNPICGTPAFSLGRPIVFGLLADRQTAVCIDLPNEVWDDPADPAVLRPNLYNPGSGVTYIPFRVPTTGRVYSVFTDPRAISAYVVDLTCSGIVGRTNCSAIYDANDTNMQYPLGVFSVRAIAFSK